MISIFLIIIIKYHGQNTQIITKVKISVGLYGLFWPTNVGRLHFLTR